MPVSPSSPERLRWMILVAAIALSVVLYGGIVYLVASQPVPAVEGGDMIRVVLLFLGLGSLGSAYLLMPKVDAGTTPAPRIAPKAFFTRSLVALVIAESAAVFGLVSFFLTRRLVDFGALAAGALSVMLFHILPQGLRYWDRGPGPGSSAGPGPVDPS